MKISSTNEFKRSWSVLLASFLGIGVSLVSVKNYGIIYGFQYSVFSLGAGISPVLAGYIWDSSGNYDLALIGGTILLIIAVIMALTLPRFSKI